MHGVNWAAVRSQYEKMLEDCVSREDVGYVISEMISEMNVGHAYYRVAIPAGTSGRPPDCWDANSSASRTRTRSRSSTKAPPGMSTLRNPLRQAGIKEGEFLLAVNRVPLTMDRDPWAAMQGLAGQAVVLTVSKEPKSGKEDRDVVVTLLGSDTELRYRQWIEKNRKYVEEKTGGRVGYVYVPDTGTNGQNDLYRQLYGQIAKEALIIDDRWNGGGQIPTRFIELLNRPVTNYWARRDGRDMTWPPDAHHGPKCMLINGLAGSGGDMFPALFRQAELGQAHRPAHLGRPGRHFRQPGPDRRQRRHGAHLRLLREGRDMGHRRTRRGPGYRRHRRSGPTGQWHEHPQLEAAINHMLSELNERPYTRAARPAYPDRSGFGIKPEDK